VPNDRDVTYIDDLQDTASPGIGRLEPNSDQSAANPDVSATVEEGTGCSNTGADLRGPQIRAAAE